MDTEGGLCIYISLDMDIYTHILFFWSILTDVNLVATMVLEESNVKNKFSLLVWGFSKWLFNMTRFKNIIDSLSSSKDSTNSLWCEGATEICRVSLLDSPNQSLARGKHLILIIYF